VLWLFCIDKDGLAVRGKLLNEVHGLPSADPSAGLHSACAVGSPSCRTSLMLLQTSSFRASRKS